MAAQRAPTPFLMVLGVREFLFLRVWRVFLSFFFLRCFCSSSPLQKRKTQRTFGADQVLVVLVRKLGKRGAGLVRVVCPRGAVGGGGASGGLFGDFFFVSVEVEFFFTFAMIMLLLLLLLFCFALSLSLDPHLRPSFHRPHRTFWGLLATTVLRGGMLFEKGRSKRRRSFF